MNENLGARYELEVLDKREQNRLRDQLKKKEISVKEFLQLQEEWSETFRAKMAEIFTPEPDKIIQ